MKIREIASGLQFPEGPVAMADGSVILVEIARGTLSRVTPDGRIHVLADLGGGPNGAAIGPDGAVYVCNNGGFGWTTEHGCLRPTGQAADYSGGRIERVDLASGRSERLYDTVDGLGLRGPNDLVFDVHGGLYFTDLGKTRAHDMDRGGLFYARADGSSIHAIARPVLTPNGIALSPDGRTLYYAETTTVRLRRRSIVGPGELEPADGHGAETLVCGLPGDQRFDSLAVDADGNVCIGTLITGCITVVSPDGAVDQRFLPPGLDDRLPTNICFGGSDRRTAYITLASTGRLVACPWPVPGLAVAFEA
jgi:gluconolactonase